MCMYKMHLCLDIYVIREEPEKNGVFNDDT